MKGKEINWKEFFTESEDLKNLSPNCVDGRPWKGNQRLVPQFLGGSFHFAVIMSLLKRKALRWPLIEKVFETLLVSNYKLGLHRGSHRDPEAGISDCGFVDNIEKVLRVIRDDSAYLFEALPHYTVNSALKILGISITDSEVNRVREESQNAASFVLEKGVLFGEEVIRKAQERFKSDLVVYELEGDHAEQAALVNLSDDRTFDTLRANEAGIQAFNLDLKVFYSILPVFKLSKKESLNAAILSLDLYQATEKVLVEDKGKPALPVLLITE